MMAWSYDRLWIMLVRKKMNKTQLMKASKLNTTIIAKMGREEPVTMEVLGKICAFFDCKLEDIVEYVQDES